MPSCVPMTNYCTLVLGQGPVVWSILRCCKTWTPIVCPNPDHCGVMVSKSQDFVLLQHTTSNWIITVLRIRSCRYWHLISLVPKSLPPDISYMCKPWVPGLSSGGRGLETRLLASLLFRYTSMNLIFLIKGRPRCHSKSPTAQDMFQSIPSLISQTFVHWNMLSYRVVKVCPIYSAGDASYNVECLENLFVQLPLEDHSNAWCVVSQSQN